ncbi:MAG: hypothetical protein ACP5PB_06265 [Acidimicrobiales bacterium]
MTLLAAFSPGAASRSRTTSGESNMRWIPAHNLDEAVRLSRAIDQRLQTVEVNHCRDEGAALDGSREGASRASGDAGWQTPGIERPIVE